MGRAPQFPCSPMRGDIAGCDHLDHLITFGHARILTTVNPR
jgi:hypothetical protein